jgi:hypothetical protein
MNIGMRKQPDVSSIDIQPEDLRVSNMIELAIIRSPMVPRVPAGENKSGVNLGLYFAACIPGVNPSPHFLPFNPNC